MDLPAAGAGRLFPLRLVAAVSGVYDLGLAALLLLLRDQLVAWFHVPPPAPPIHADLNALFLMGIGLGYWLPFRDPARYRGYLWVMGPVLKGAGAVAFVMDVTVRASPAAYLLFASTDGVLAIVTLAALLAVPAGATSPSRAESRPQ